MRELLKKLLRSSPAFLKRTALYTYEQFVETKTLEKEKRIYLTLPSTKKTSGSIKNILIYHISGLSFGGTEKNLQSLANGLCDTYNIFFMYSDKNVKESRISCINEKVALIPFEYSTRESVFPYFISRMNPHIKEIITKHSIDLVVTAGSGNSEYPLNTIEKTPILMINIFGSPTVQKNIIKNIFISKTVQKYSEQYTGPSDKNVSLCIPVKDPIINQIKIDSLKQKINLQSGDFVFGRIGRASDDIFDPIGIRAFQKIVTDFPNAKYLIMSPPPKVKSIVTEEKIKNVFFLDPSSDEEDIWAFHTVLDCLAHFRYDGETFGLNIAESMLVGNPIISHTSRIWNAHTDYLNSSFARVAEIDNTEEYAAFMKEFIFIKEKQPAVWEKMRVAAKEYAVRNFSEKEYIHKVKSILQSISK